ncbi:hypothetical protein BDV93DRAFT_610832 [Ceratobasidium sp. AG-I]|nr:hypothetical protein BDV93DRAFT_610832 [Ceratobasidium sp. AG-I]
MSTTSAAFNLSPTSIGGQVRHGDITFTGNVPTSDLVDAAKLLAAAASGNGPSPGANAQATDATPNGNTSGTNSITDATRADADNNRLAGAQEHGNTGSEESGGGEAEVGEGNGAGHSTSQTPLQTGTGAPSLNIGLPSLTGPKIKQITAPEKLDSPKTPLVRINAIWNKWLHSYASSSQYVEPAVHRYDVTYRDVPDLVVCTQDSEFKAEWKILFSGFPGKGKEADMGPAETQWIPIRDHMQHVCARHKDQSPKHVITAFGRWVQFWEVQTDGSLAPAEVKKSEMPALDGSEEQTYLAMDIGKEVDIKLIDSHLSKIFSE